MADTISQDVMGDPAKSDEEGTDTSGIRKNQRMVGDKICRVCGDKALAHNFDVISCESCKAFFRRNALKSKIKACAFSGDCDVNIETRRYCPHCRLQKCLASGMKSCMILGTEERKARLEKMAENRRQRQLAQGIPTGTERSAPSGFGYVTSATSGLGSSSGSGSGSEDQAEQQGASENCGEDVNVAQSSTSGSQQEIPSGCQAGFSEVYCKSGIGHNFDRIDTTFEHVAIDKLPSDPHMYWHLTEEERSILSDLTAVYQETVLKLPQNRNDDCPNANSMSNILDRCRRYPEAIVNFVKRFKDFRTLGVEDQVAAMKGASFRAFLVKAAATFIVEKDSWVNLTVADFARASGSHAHRVYLMACFASSLKRILRNDSTALALLQCITLFDPRDANISDRQLVNSLSDKYNLLLKHHMESHFSYQYAGHYLEAIRKKLVEMDHVAEVVQVMYNDWVDFLEPLMREVLNLG